MTLSGNETSVGAIHESPFGNQPGWQWEKKSMVRRGKGILSGCDFSRPFFIAFSVFPIAENNSMWYKLFSLNLFCETKLFGHL